MIKLIFAAMVVVAAGYLFALPYLTALEMKRAADAKDAAALSAYIDYSAVRASVKSQVNRRIETRAGSKAGAQLGALAAALTAPISDRVVEAIIDPDSLVAIFEGEVPDASGQIQRDEPAADGGETESGKRLSFGYKSHRRFEVEIANEDGEITRLVLGRRGLDWKLVEVHLPSLAVR